MSNSNNGYTMYTPYGGSRSAPTSPQNIYVPPPQGTNVLSNAVAPQMVNHPNYTYLVTITDMISPTNKELVWTIGRTVKWIAIIDTVFSLIYAFVLWPYLFAAFLSLSGWYGAKNFRPNFIILYIIYQFLTIIFRMFLIYYRPSMGGIILGVFSLLIETYIIQITVKFCKILKALSYQDRKELQEGWQPDRSMQVTFY